MIKNNPQYGDGSQQKLKIVILSPMRKQYPALFTPHNTGTDMRNILGELVLIIELHYFLQKNKSLI